jgi:sugar phosphate isomerase/epimerase
MSVSIRPATMKGPAIFLAQFIGDAQPFDSFDAICGWAAGLGYKDVQVPTSDPRLIDIDKAAASQTYCDEIAGVAASHGLVITELSTHLQGQLVAVHPAYNEAFDAFAPPAVRGRPNERQIWAVDQMMKAAQASRRLGLTGSVSFTGALAWPFLYPWPQRPPGLIETAFDELARRWRPILDAYEEAGVDLCYEVHPGGAPPRAASTTAM